MTTIFDCESHETALNSVAMVYEVEAERIRIFLRDFDLEKHIVPGIDPINVTLIQMYEQEFGSLKHVPGSVYWFHCTRVDRTETFEEGILPLGKALDKIWNTMFSIFHNTVHEEKLRRLKNEGVNDHFYQLKVPDNTEWGPYAHLIKEVAFKNEEFWSHDYLKIPEIIEDICNAYQEKYSYSIIKDVIRALAPCIVKFKSNKNTDRWVVNKAIIYLYYKYRNARFILDANTTFDAENQIIPRSDIVKIEFIEDR